MFWNIFPYHFPLLCHRKLLHIMSSRDPQRTRIKGHKEAHPFGTQESPSNIHTHQPPNKKEHALVNKAMWHASK